MTADDLLKQIRNKKDELLKLRNSYESKSEVIRLREREFKEIHAAYLELQKELSEVKTLLDEEKKEHTFIKRQGTRLKSEIPQLEAQYRKETDNERLYREFNSRVETIKESLPNALWRAENRDDEYYALPHQIEGAAKLAVVNKGILADKTGLGKSLTSLIWLDFINAKKICAIVPNDTMGNFIREVKRWTHRRPLKLGGHDKYTRELFLDTLQTLDEYFVVLNYEAWRKDYSLIYTLVNMQFDTLILDEAHHAKELKNRMTQGVHDLRFHPNLCPECGNSDFPKLDEAYEPYRDRKSIKCMNCEYRGKKEEFTTIQHVLPMTGTPILNRPGELFPQLKLIMPEEFPSMSYFQNNYCEKDYYTGTWTWESKGEKEIANRLGPRFLQRNAETAGVEIPPQEVKEHLIEFIGYPEQQRAYKQMKEYFQIVLNEDTKKSMSATEVITQLLRLRQILVWPGGVGLRDPYTKEIIERLPDYPSIKVDKAEEVIKDILDEGDRCIVFSQFTAPLLELSSRFFTTGALHIGSTPEHKKKEIQYDFDPKYVEKGNHKWDVAFCSYKTMGEGVNLHAARQMVILDYEWNPGKRDQAYGRIRRIGQMEKSIVHTLEVEKTVDTWMREIIEFKEDIIQGFESSIDIVQRVYDALESDEI